MDILNSFTAKLDKDQLKEFLREAIEKQHPGFKVASVTFHATTAYGKFDPPVFKDVENCA